MGPSISSWMFSTQHFSSTRMHLPQTKAAGQSSVASCLNHQCILTRFSLTMGQGFAGHRDAPPKIWASQPGACKCHSCRSMMLLLWAVLRASSSLGRPLTSLWDPPVASVWHNSRAPSRLHGDIYTASLGLTEFQALLEGLTLEGLKSLDDMQHPDHTPDATYVARPGL